MPRDILSVWQKWAQWGGALSRNAAFESVRASDVALDSEPVRRLAAAFRSFAHHEGKHLDDLLGQADERLKPLSDPLRLSLRKHRWLDLQREREESYSDWLAWLLEELQSAEIILKIFGLDETDFGKQVRGARPQLNREEPIRTRDGEHKRLDIVIRFGEVGILLIEVKVRSIEEAGGRENLSVYLDWLEREAGMARKYCAILLVPSILDPPADGWNVRTWDEISMRLRLQTLALQATSPENTLVAALLLCFAGAVEQNVLGLTGARGAMATPQTILYLEHFLAENRL